MGTQASDDRIEEISEAVKALLGDSRYDTVVPYYVNSAMDSVTRRLFPFGQDAEYGDVPEKWDTRTAEIAVYLIDRRGAEGEVSHSENGTSRTYQSAGIPSSYFAGMAPFTGVPR